MHRNVLSMFNGKGISFSNNFTCQSKNICGIPKYDFVGSLFVIDLLKTACINVIMKLPVKYLSNGANEL